LPPRPPGSSLLPYTTLFRSRIEARCFDIDFIKRFLRFSFAGNRFKWCRFKTKIKLRKRIHVMTISGWVEDITREHRIIGNTFYRSEEHTSELQSRFDLVCRL